MLDEANERLQARSRFDPVVGMKRESLEHRQQRSTDVVEIPRPTDVLHDCGSDLGQSLDRLGVDLSQHVLR
jgi:hypothetical protein